MSQCERLLMHLKSGPIEPLQALKDLGIYRLSARIKNLRDEGHNIETNMVDVVNQFGEPCRVAEYRLLP